MTLAAAALLTGCAGSSAPPTDSLSPTPTGAGAVVLSDDEHRQVGIYVALLDQHLFIEPGLFDTAYIDPRPGPAGAALSAQVQDAISDYFLPRVDVRWGVQDDATANNDADYVTLPQLPDDRDEFNVVVRDVCGNLCGHGQRYRVTRHGDQWKATPVGATAIS